MSEPKGPVGHNHTVGVPKKESEKGTERIFQEIIPEIFTNECIHQ